jgi:two-component system, NtrC family, response regulator AlgB
MAKQTPRILVVDDEPNILNTIGICFDALGYSADLFSRPQDALAAIATTQYDIAFIDLKMTPYDGMYVLDKLRQLSPHTTAVIITAHGSIDSAIEAMKKGAYHYLQKPFDFKELQLFAERVWEHHCLVHQVEELRNDLADAYRHGDIITRNPLMREQLALAAEVAGSAISVLVEGESGTGKEVFAQFIHEQSPRAKKQMVKVNCAALPEQLLESELFGHVRGAFTGAMKDRIGRFELADGSTIFLDEIGEMSQGIQAKLLRVLQSMEFEAVGDSRTRKVDVRVLASTNRNLDEALREGTFREDLFYRLNAVRIKLVPLRERTEDIPLLVSYFLSKFSKDTPPDISPDAMKALRTYRWSGNVRELEHVIERASILSREKIIELHHLPPEIRNALEKPTTEYSLEEIEKMHIIRVLQNAKDYDEAARILGIDPATLWRKRKKFGL